MRWYFLGFVLLFLGFANCTGLPYSEPEGKQNADGVNVEKPTPKAEQTTDAGQGKPDKATTTPDKATTTPDKATTTPDKATTTPDKATSTPDKSTTAPDKSTTTPDKSTTTPDKGVVVPDTHKVDSRPPPDRGTVTPPLDPPVGNPAGKCKIPAGGGVENTSNPTTVVGTGTPASCTGAAFVSAVAKGGIITFNCGPKPVTITLTKTAKIFNDKGPKIVIDGGGKVTLSGGGKVRILYQNTCDQNQKWTTSRCQDQDHPQLTVQNLTFIQGNAKGDKYEGGGAIFVRGGRFKAVNCRFFNNVCDDTGPDVGGAAIRVLSQSKGLPVFITNCTFGGKKGLGNVCSNGGGLSSIGVSYTVTNSLFSHNKAIGRGANPAKSGTPGGGSGGAIYNDGNTFTLSLCGVQINDNTANEGGGAIFFVSNNRTGTLIIKDSNLFNNPSGKFETKGYPGIFVLAKGAPQITNSTLK